jgi:hypothetical protein
MFRRCLVQITATLLAVLIVIFRLSTEMLEKYLKTDHHNLFWRPYLFTS